MIKIHEGDDLEIETEVLEDGSPKDITGAELAAAAEKDGTVVNATTAMVDAAQGVFRANFAIGALAAGKWDFQARVTLGSTSRVVATEQIVVQVSHV